jgi:hypothetical protein
MPGPVAPALANTPQGSNEPPGPGVMKPYGAELRFRGADDGNQPAYSAWEANSSAERTFYMCWSNSGLANPNINGRCGFGSIETRLRYGCGSAVVRSRRGYGRGTAPPICVSAPPGVRAKPSRPFLKSAQCRFESDWGHGKRTGQRRLDRRRPASRRARRGVVAARAGLTAARSAR